MAKPDGRYSFVASQSDPPPKGTVAVKYGGLKMNLPATALIAIVSAVSASYVTPSAADRELRDIRTRQTTAEREASAFRESLTRDMAAIREQMRQDREAQGNRQTQIELRLDRVLDRLSSQR